MQVRRLDDKLFDCYNIFLNTNSSAMLYYSLPFKFLLEDFLKCDSEYLVVLHNGKIEGVLPLMSKDGKYGKILNSLPFFGSNGGILANSLEAELAIMQAYNELSNYAASTLVSNPLYIMQKPSTFDFLDCRIGQWTHLINQKSLLESFESSAVRNIKKAQRQGIKVICTNDIEFLYATHYENMQQIGGIYKEKGFFERINQYFIFQKEWVVYTAIYKGIPVAGLLLFYFKDTIEYYIPATLSTYRTLQAMPLLIYTAMCDGIQNGYKMWNFGGTWDSQDNVHRFKKKFGAMDRKYFYYTKLNNQEILYSSKEELLKEYPYFYVIPFKQLKG